MTPSVSAVQRILSLKNVHLCLLDLPGGQNPVNMTQPFTATKQAEVKEVYVISRNEQAATWNAHKLTPSQSVTYSILQTFSRATSFSPIHPLLLQGHRISFSLP